MGTSSTLRAMLVAGLAAALAACAGAQDNEPADGGSLNAVDVEPTAGSFNHAVVRRLRTAVDVPFTKAVQCGVREGHDEAHDCVVPLDVLAPRSGEALPTIVLIPGGPVAFDMRRYLDRLGAALSRKGAVVFLTSYRSSATGNEPADSLLDVRCAIRFARSATAKYRGDPSRVVLVGHSVGSELVLQTALSQETSTPGCLADGDGTPQSVVAIAGFHVTLDGIAGSAVPMLLVGSESDRYSEGGQEVAEQLREQGYDAEYREFAEATHSELVDPDARPEIVGAVFEMVEPSSPG
jgi:acetyl esterase/lipase